SAALTCNDKSNNCSFVPFGYVCSHSDMAESLSLSLSLSLSHSLSLSLSLSSLSPSLSLSLPLSLPLYLSLSLRVALSLFLLPSLPGEAHLVLPSRTRGSPRLWAPTRRRCLSLGSGLWAHPCLGLECFQTFHQTQPTERR